jgi:NAD-dependent DNA ligase
MKGKSVCMTGFRDAAMEDAIAAQGGVVKGSVSKTLTYLVALDPASASGKAQQAREYQQKGLPVQIVGIDDMWTILGGKPTA